MKEQLRIQKQIEMSCLCGSHVYFPLHLSSRQVSFLFGFSSDLGRRNPGFGRRGAWNPHAGAAILVQSTRPVTLPALGKPRFQIFPSFHKGVLFAKGFGSSWNFLSFCLLKCSLWGWNTAGFFSPSSPRCSWFSGCTPVKPGHWGEGLKFYLQQRRMWTSHASV